MSDIITTLHPKDTVSDNLYPNIKTENIPNSGVTTAKINDSAVTTAKLNDGSVTTAKLNDASVSTIKLVDSAVTSSKITDNAVTTAKIANGSITPGKLAFAVFRHQYILRGTISDSSYIDFEVNFICSDGTYTTLEPIFDILYNYYGTKVRSALVINQSGISLDSTEGFCTSSTDIEFYESGESFNINWSNTEIVSSNVIELFNFEYSI